MQCTSVKVVLLAVRSQSATLNRARCILVKQLCGLEASQGTVAEVLSSAASAKADDVDSNDELDPEDEERDNERKEARKKKNKRLKGTISQKSLLKHAQHLTRLLIWTFFFDVIITESSESGDGNEYPLDVWLVLSSYIRPEDLCKFALICRSAWTATCTAAFWTRLYRR